MWMRVGSTWTFGILLVKTETVNAMQERRERPARVQVRKKSDKEGNIKLHQCQE